MSRYKAHNFEIPAETVRVAQLVYPQGNVYLALRDKLGPLYADPMFAELYAWQGQAGVSPGLLAQVTVMQYMEGLTDRQAAEAVRSRIDWKYALGLALTDSGFDYSILSPFRDRLLAGGKEGVLFEAVLDKLKEAQLLGGRKEQRTDTTHVVLAVRQLTRLEFVGETLRRALDDLAQVAPEWLVEQVEPSWFERYERRVESYRLPTKKNEIEALQRQIGADGRQLLQAIYQEQTLTDLAHLPSVEVLRQVWIQQYYLEQGALQWRQSDNQPPHHLLIVSPDDIEARNRTKRQRNWSGYVLQLTETCAADHLNLITDVATAPATTPDIDLLAPTHQAQAQRDLLPQQHWVDGSYLSTQQLRQAKADYQLDLIGPLPDTHTWQDKEQPDFSRAAFHIDWQAQTVTCPQGNTSRYWHTCHDPTGQPYIAVRFHKADCLSCPAQSQCTRSKQGVRGLSFKPKADFEALQAARQQQHTPAFKALYQRRAGIEGTISQGVRAFGLRRARYIGLAKTHLQHLVSAAAINLTRVAYALLHPDAPKAPTRISPFASLKPT